MKGSGPCAFIVCLQIQKLFLFVGRSLDMMRIRISGSMYKLDKRKLCCNVKFDRFNSGGIGLISSGF